MFGWTGKLAIINLSKNEIKFNEPPLELYLKFIGGRGLAGFFLKPYITLEWDNGLIPLLLFTGPLVGTISPTSGRMTMMSKSPLTGTIGDSSVGGKFGTMLKKAGFDGVIITGKSEYLCGIEITDDDIKINRVEHLKNKSISYVHSIIKDKGSTAIIGPAAENGVLFSSIIIDGHFASGRSGIGLTMAEKKIKYITAFGTKKIKISDFDELKKAREEIVRLTSASPALFGNFGISRFGTGALYDLIDSRHMMPTLNFKKINFEYASSMNAHAYKKKYNPKSIGCSGCHILCKKITDDGTAIPEYETMSHFSALIGNNDIEAVVQANKICNEVGMDTISAASTIACFLEVSNKKLSPSEILSLLEDIGNKKGIGAELGMGSANYAEIKGNKDTSMSVKKLELPAYDPRGAYGMALAYATSTRGGCHLRAYPISHEILRKPVATDRFTFAGKARIIKISEDLNAAADSLTACKFIFFAATLEEYARVFSAVTGIKMFGQDILKAGERIYYNEIIMNSMNGFNSKHDDLPKRFFELESVNKEIKPLNREAFLLARSNYYKVRGLNENGNPSFEKTKELGIDDDLWKIS
ncbi:MAG: aldehyde ferredoxin oxidoreductase family protein [Desulfobacterales bacterium]|nr:aldehyde ferredoxin oxidoreductase family protein [Desulfobacterales bacterium]